MKQLSLLICLAVIPAVVRADTVAFWRFGEKPAGQAGEVRGPIRDASGFGNHGRLLGPAKYVGGAGSDGTAIEWNGSGLLDVPDAHVFDFRGDFTIEAMVRTSSSGAQAWKKFNTSSRPLMVNRKHTVAATMKAITWFLVSADMHDPMARIAPAIRKLPR